jgi:sucrose phosphorylase
LITETNVPHEDNISYFGNGHDEAHMVYNFALPPLVLYTFYTEDATALSQWAQGIKNPSNVATFFNILDTHDGIGLMGAKSILSKEDIHLIIEKAKEHGAYISYKMTEDRTEEPYEVNIAWWSAINRDDSDEDMGLLVKRYIASRSISLVLQGVPGVYAHGIIGSSSDHELVERTNHNRDVNRSVIDSKSVAEGFKDPNSKISHLRRDGSKLNLTRTRERAFHPHGEQQVLMVSPSVFAVLRTSPEGDQHILTMTNVSKRTVQIEISLPDLNIQETRWYDLLAEKDWIAEKNKLSVILEPYDVIWLKPFSEL